MKLELIPALAFASCGVLLGIGATTFEYAEGLSYLSTDPKACANCHIMRCVRCHVSVGHGEPLGLGGPMRAEETHGMSEQ